MEWKGRVLGRLGVNRRSEVLGNVKVEENDEEKGGGRARREREERDRKAYGEKIP